MSPPRKLRRTPEDRSLQIGKRMSSGTGQGRVDSASPVRNTLPAKATQSRGGNCINEEFTWFEPGVLGTWTGTDRWYPPFEVKIFSIRASVDTAPTGAPIKIDINKNGTSILVSALRPSIAVSTNTVEVTAIQDPLMALGDYLTFDIDQVGSTVTGSDLAITIGFTVCPTATATPGLPPPSSECYPNVVLNDEPLAFWRLDEPSGTTAVDSTGNGHDATLSSSGLTYGETGPVPCDSGTGILFSSNGHGRFSVNLDLSTTAVVTLECWWKNTVAWNPGTDDLLAEFNGPWFSTQPSFIVDPNFDTGGGVNGFMVSTHGNVGEDVFYFSHPSLNAFHHYVFVFDFSQNAAGECKAYVDGALASLSQYGSAVNNTNTAFVSGTLTMMCRVGTEDLDLDGVLADVAIYTYELTSTQVSNHYASGT